jgi:NSS family neurotransmitter:Na+ symporter
VVGLACYAATLQGASAGYGYYLTTDFRSILSFEVLKDAAGQAFFSLSLGMGAMLTYASYLEREHDLPREAVTIAVSDFSVAFLAGLVVFPLLFALGLQGDVMGKATGTMGALFVVLPTAFADMGRAGLVIGLLFFLALLVGALTSAISLLEVVVSSAIDGLAIPRRTAAWLCGGAIALLGIPPALDLNVLGLMDQLGGNVFLLLGGLLLAIFTGWVAHEPAQEAQVGTSFGGLGAWRWLLRWVVPALLGVVLLFSLADTWKALRDFTF